MRVLFWSFCVVVILLQLSCYVECSAVEENNDDLLPELAIPDVHFVFSAPDSDTCHSKIKNELKIEDSDDDGFSFADGYADQGDNEEDVFLDYDSVYVPKTELEWRGYILWAEKKGNAGAKEAFINDQQGSFWHENIVEMNDAKGRHYRCYYEKGSKKVDDRKKEQKEEQHKDDSEVTPEQKELIEKYFKARDYKTAVTLISTEANLQPSCIRGSDGTYTYVLCGGRHIKQMRYAPNTGEKLEEYTLGVPSTKDNRVHDKKAKDHAMEIGSLEWIAQGREHRESHVTRFEHDRSGRHFVHFYRGGDECWATKLPRTAEVSYVCDASLKAPRITRVEESSPCNYRLRVASPAICKHPFFSESFGLKDKSAGDGTTSHDLDQSEIEENGKRNKLVLCVADRTEEDFKSEPIVSCEQPDKTTMLGLYNRKRIETQTREFLREKQQDQQTKIAELVKNKLAGKTDDKIITINLGEVDGGKPTEGSDSLTEKIKEIVEMAEKHQQQLKQDDKQQQQQQQQQDQQQKEQNPKEIVVNDFGDYDDDDDDDDDDDGISAF